VTADDDARPAGDITWHNYARRGYARLARGVYGRVGPTTGLDQWQARRARFLALTRGVLAAYRDLNPVLYGPTAFQVMRVALPEAMEDWARCHLLVPDDAWRPARQEVVAHATRRLPDRRWLDGFPVLHPVDHWLQLRGTDDQLIEVADGLVRRQHPLVTLDEFERRLGELSGANGIKRGRRLLGWVVAGTDSPYETRTRLALVRAGLPRPTVNLPVRTRSGRLYYLDLAYERELVAVEYDGAGHAGDRAQMEYDARRRRDLQEAGWLIITLTAPELDDPVSFVRSVEAALILRHRR